MAKQPLSSPPPSEPVSQFRRSVEKIELAQNSGQDPAPYEANARLWLAIVKLTSPQEANNLEAELNRTTGHTPARGKDVPSAPADARSTIKHIAWACVLVALVFTFVGPDLLVHVIAFISLACLLGVILVL